MKKYLVNVEGNLHFDLYATVEAPSEEAAKEWATSEEAKRQICNVVVQDATVKNLRTEWLERAQIGDTFSYGVAPIEEQPSGAKFHNFVKDPDQFVWTPPA